MFKRSADGVISGVLDYDGQLSELSTETVDTPSLVIWAYLPPR